jgi:envelope integrity protein B
MQATDKGVPGAWLQEAGRIPMLRRNRAARRQIAMTILGRSALGTVTVAAALALVGLGVRHATALPPGSELASHRAIYELKLAQTRGNSAVAARGRILYDFSGNACEGYALQFRQVSELDNGEGKVTLSDLRSTTWEDGAAKKFIFKSQNYLNETLLDSVDGQAERQRDKVAVTLNQPVAKTFDLEAGMVFPTEHMRRIIAAAREGKNILELPVYDGSEKGEKVYDTLTVIGAEIAPERVPNDAAAGKQALAGLKRWPVTVSYFDKTARSSDQAPVYAIKFEVYENGVSRALMLDYNDFAISGELIAIELRDSAPCK